MDHALLLNTNDHGFSIVYSSSSKISME